MVYVEVMLSFLIVLFVAMPIVEIVILIEVGHRIGGLETLGLIIGTGVLGAALARAQGLKVIQGIRQDMAEGRLPAPRLVDGLMIIVAGVLMITPGLVTDAMGFMLLMPPVRTVIRKALRTRMEVKLQHSTGMKPTIDIDVDV